MAELLPESVVFHNGIRIELKKDGGVEIYADSERFSVMTRQGRGQNPNTGRLHSAIVIAPLFERAEPATPSAPTITNLNEQR